MRLLHGVEGWIPLMTHFSRIEMIYIYQVIIQPEDKRYVEQPSLNTGKAYVLESVSRLRMALVRRSKVHVRSLYSPDQASLFGARRRSRPLPPRPISAASLPLCRIAPSHDRYLPLMTAPGRFQVVAFHLDRPNPLKPNLETVPTSSDNRRPHFGDDHCDKVTLIN